jgi:hypothetical protein
MQIKIKRLSIAILVGIATFAAGVGLAVRWIVPRFNAVDTPVALNPTELAKPEEIAIPNGWRKLELKNRVSILLPEDMKPIEPPGDSRSYREAYSNRDLNIIMVYGEPTPCDTPRYLLEGRPYRESVIDIDGRKAKIDTDYYYQPKFIVSGLCFVDADSSGMQLRVETECTDNHALETAQQIFTSIRFKDNR